MGDLRQRNYVIDFAKAIAIVLVVIGHWYPTTSPAWWIGIRDVIYSFHMPLFMAASGYIYIYISRSYAAQNYGSFLLGKVKRLMVPYISTSIIVITIKLLTQGDAYVENPVTLGSYLEIFYRPAAGYYLWFIWALWWMFVIVPFFKKKSWRVGLFVVALVAAYLPWKAPEIFCLRETQGMLVYFMTGVMLYEYRQVLTWLYRVPWYVVLAVFGVLEGCFLAGMPGIWYALSYAGILTMLSLSKAIERSGLASLKAKLCSVASASYIIYLFHTTFEGFAKSALGKLVPSWIVGDDWITFAIASVVIVSVGVIVPLWLYRYLLGRWRLSRFLFGLK